MKCFHVPPRWLSFPLFLLALSLALPALADDRGEGPLDTSQPQGITVEEIIQKFAAKEKQFKIAREQYTYRQSVTVQTIDGDSVDGEFKQVEDVLFDDQGKRLEQVVFAPQDTLTRITMTRQDFDDIQHRMPFVPALAREAIRLTRWLHRLLAGRRRGHRPAGADAAIRRAAAGPHAARRVPGAAGRTGPAEVGPGADRRGNHAHQRRAAEGRGGPVPAAGGHRGRARRGQDHGRHRLAADPRALRPAGTTSPNRFTTLNRAVAVAMVRGPQAGLEVIATLAADKRMAQHHRLLAARAHMHELAGDTDAAAADYLDAARRALGSQAIAIAIITRWRMPPESWCG